MLEVYDLKTMHMKSPVIDQNPYFSWKLKSDKQNVMQEAYQIANRDIAILDQAGDDDFAISVPNIIISCIFYKFISIIAPIF